ncbi:developmentally Regulated MAPK Interacting protein [Colletotrichum graminicola]|uniref:Developmentally Regulated MAPK Interacting protein n=1 Tax=Colletotrichum graminicola (strain M1.001 / M2 / FGSC 10212) TaxID=645133 RepID=E3Q5K2_COLGM|nr:developmentally Regulated MAPK Interacting protein [Colletotrichum graminicola M1.001]EFQ25969.1 developmentally Regulated MAPK Interacting protein [Colletotrichum graminicola M1.001]WDK23090.1 developmentally Regulated MAPK Interacting protein [Colletotrichum graminicola]
MRFSATALALVAPLVSAIEFTSPSINSTVTKGSSYELTWKAVDTDPSAFSIFLVNFVNWPPSYTLLAENIETSAGAVSVDVPCSASNSYGYQFNAINGTNVYVIYAQTPKFSISGADCTGPTTLPPASPSICAPPSTVTVTVSKTLSRNSTAVATGGISAAQSKITTPAAVSASSQTTSSPVFHGTCPDIIGWASDYYHPVALTKPPRHPDNAAAFALPTNAPLNRRR